MKTAKKVLSIVLAVMMILSTMVIAVSASADDVSFTWTLGAEVYNATAGAAKEAKDSGYEETPNTKAPTATKQKADVTAYKGLTTHVYADTSKVIPVQPGQVVWLTLHVKSTGGAYTASLENCLYYTKNIFLSSTNTWSAAIAANTKSTWGSYGCMGWGNGNFFSRMNANTRKKYTTTAGMDPDTYHAYYLFGKPTDVTMLDGVMKADFDDDLVSFPIYVDPDAKLGAEGNIFLGGGFKTWASGYSTCEGDIWGEPDQWTGAAHDQSGAVLNFVVGDYADLEAAIKAFEALTESDYTEDSWKVAADAYSAAKDAKTKATAQAELDAAAKDLNDAIADLKEAEDGPVLDFTALNAALQNCIPESPESAYTVTSYDNYALAYVEAEEALEATTQEQINDAASALEEAFSGLKLKADVSGLEEALSAADDVETSNWTKDSVDALDAAVNAGQAIMENADDISADSQAAVNKATDDIWDAMSNYVLKDANYSVINGYAIQAGGLNRELYTQASLNALDSAFDVVDYTLKIDQQSVVDGWAADILAALQGLKEKADTSALQEAVTAALSANEADYDAAVWSQIQSYVADAANYIGKDLAAEDVQTAINALTQSLNDALANKLADADYALVIDAIANLPKDLSAYTAASIEALSRAENAVQYNLKDTEENRALIADWAEAITNALKLKADTTELEAAVTAAGSANEADYAAEVWSLIQGYVADAANYIGKDLAAEDAQTAINTLTQNLNDALANKLVNSAIKYVYWDFDNDCELAPELAAKVTNNNAKSYTEGESVAISIEDVAIDNERYIVKSVSPEAIDAEATGEQTVTITFELKVADYTAITNAISAIPEDLSVYTEESIEALNTAKAAVEYNLKDTDENRLKIANWANDIANALVLADGDYEEIIKYLGQIAVLNADDYTIASWNALQEFIEGIPMTLKADEQDTIDEYAYGLRQAKNGLVLAGPADYTGVAAQQQAANALNEDYYTPESWAVLEGALGAVKEGLNKNHQAEVNKMATDIEDAITALVLKDADYTAVDAAILRFNQMDQNLYTKASVDAVKKAISDVVRDKKANEQEAVNAMAAAIEKAIGELEIKPEPVGMVKSVEYTDTALLTKTYTVKVEGRAFKIQFVDANGNTITFSRVDNRDKIVSYTESGEVTTDIARDLAYEIWTVTLSIKDGAYIVKARNEVTGWETNDLGCAFDVVSSEKDIQVKSVEPAETTYKLYEKLPVTVKTGKDVLKIKFVVNGVDYMTFDSAYSELVGDELVFNAFVKLYTKGTNEISVMIKTASGWTTTEAGATVTGIK